VVASQYVWNARVVVLVGTSKPAGICCCHHKVLNPNLAAACCLCAAAAASCVLLLPRSYFIVAGLVFTPATVPYLRSEYGKEYDFDAPVRVLVFGV
jgi:hypothetical protein